jgi:Plant mobile domain
VTDDEWSGTVEMLLGLDIDPYSYDDIIDNPWPFKIRNRGNESKYIQYRFACLRKRFKELPPYSDNETVRRYKFYSVHEIIYIHGSTNFFCRYARAFCLDLFGSVMFPNNSADSVTAVYLSFIDDMLNVLEESYDWGQTILSCLYFNLSRSCLELADCIAGPLLLLQMWSWT